MKNKELRNILKQWITQVLITEGSYTIEIISSHQNTPSPDSTYITMLYGPPRNPNGRATKTEVYYNEEDPEDEDNGKRVIAQDWTINVELRETNGEGDLLRELIDSLEREDILNNYFRANNLAHYTNGQILPVPRLDQEDWTRESIVELVLGTAESFKEFTDYIETVEYEGNIGGLQDG